MSFSIAELRLYITIVLATLARLVMSNRNLNKVTAIVLAPFRAAAQLIFHSSGTQRRKHSHLAAICTTKFKTIYKDIMARQNPTFETLRALFAKSGNRCAFPGCPSVLVNEHNLFIGQVCHIEAASENGPRFNASQPNEDRRSYDNLVLFCYPHHVEVDHDPVIYTPSRLKEIKKRHEQTVDKLFAVDDALVRGIAMDMEVYWLNVERANKHEHVAPDFAVKIDTQASYLSLADSVAKLLDSFHDSVGFLSNLDETLNDDILVHLHKLGYDTAAFEAVPYYENPFMNRGWEIRSLAIPNLFTDLHILLCQMEIKYLELHHVLNADDQVARDRLSNLKEEFLKLARRAGRAD